jgi:hypothetical protein
MDLCRDPALSSGDWHCAVCGQPYDKARIEARLVAALQQRLKEYALQDLACTRCKQVGGGRGEGWVCGCVWQGVCCMSCHTSFTALVTPHTAHRLHRSERAVWK